MPRFLAIGFSFALLLVVGCAGGDATSPQPTPTRSATLRPTRTPVPTRTPPPTATPPPNPLFVRLSGNDTNTGADPGHALRTISRAAQVALGGDTIVVGPGTYREGVTVGGGGAVRALLLIADPSGTRTGDAAGRVSIDATGAPEKAGFKMSGSPGTVIDGFVVSGGTDGGIVVKSGSDNATIRNCTVFSNAGDGIRLQDSANVLVFNNLMYGNGGTGIGVVGQISGAPHATVVNNTIAGNGGRGITVGNTQAASPGAFVRNNIVQGNLGDANIKVFTPPPAGVPRSDVGYSEDFDLVFPPFFLPPTLAGLHDIGADALFVNSGAGDFHLRLTSPAIDAGDPLSSLPALAGLLRLRTTTGAAADSGPLDLGFHYAP